LLRKLLFKIEEDGNKVETNKDKDIEAGYNALLVAILSNKVELKKNKLM
jgi:hypothetical protein